MTNLLNIQQIKTLIYSYVFPYLYYTPLVWMFCRIKDNKLINKVHKRALRLIHNNLNLNFEELLSLEKSFTIHESHLQFLMTEVFKSLHDMNPQMICELFDIKAISYNLRSKMLLKIPSANTITSDFEKAIQNCF